MYMGVILIGPLAWGGEIGAPHVYGGDPKRTLDTDKV